MSGQPSISCSNQRLYSADLIPENAMTHLRELTPHTSILQEQHSHENWLPVREEQSMLRGAAIRHWYRDSYQRLGGSGHLSIGTLVCTGYCCGA